MDQKDDALPRRGRDRIPLKADATHREGMRLRTQAEDAGRPSPQADAVHVALEAFPVPALVMDDDGRITTANRAWAAFAGRPDDVLTGEHWLCLVLPEDRKKATAAIAQSRRTGQVCECELRLRHRDGRHRWVAVHARRQPDEDALPTRWLVVCTDVHDHLRARQKLAKDVHLRDDMLNNSADCIKIIDPQGGLVHMNRAGCRALGVPETETRFGMAWLELLPPEVRVRGQRALSQARNGRSARFPGKSIQAAEEIRYWDNLLTPLKDENGRTALILCVSRDVTSQRQVERRLRISSEVDSLTSLYNRRAFRSRVERLVRKARKKRTELGLLLIDLDHFKLVNDTFGHPAGDHLLRTLSGRLKACLPEDSTVIARLGGDEFAIVMDCIDGEQGLAAAAEQVLRQLEAPISYSGHLVTEHMLLKRGAEFVADALRVLKSHGVRVSLDDFGTGHSSFVHLRDYPVDSLKIDAAFVGGMLDSPSSLAIVKAIAALGPLLGVDVIAEGVETAQQRAILLEVGCRLGQGRLFAPVQDAETIAALLQRRSPRSA